MRCSAISPQLQKSLTIAFLDHPNLTCHIWHWDIGVRYSDMQLRPVTDNTKLGHQMTS